MYKIRPLDTPTVVKHNTYPQIQVLPNYANVPLKNVDFSQRWCSMPQRFEGIIEDVVNFKIRSDDLFVITFMKSGTTWMPEAAWLILNDMDFATAKWGRRCHFLTTKSMNPSFQMRGVLFEFMRRGIVGAYKDEMSEEQCQYLNEWSKSYLAKYGLEY